MKDDQAKGDKAFSDGNYKKALKHYKNIFNNLNQSAAQRGFKITLSFQDNLACALSDIIITASNMISLNKDSFNFSAVSAQWSEITSFLGELESLYPTLSNYPERKKTDEKIRFVYNALAIASDIISDNLNNEEALTWFEKSITYRKKAMLDISMEVHIGYLYLLEQIYKSTNDNQYLIKITEYFQNNSLDNMELLPLEKLEILGYKFFVAINLNQKNAEGLAEQCKNIISSLDNVESTDLLISEVNQLIEQLPHSQLSMDSRKKDTKFETALQENLPIKKRKVYLQPEETLHAKLPVVFFPSSPPFSQKNDNGVLLDTKEHKSLLTI